MKSSNTKSCSAKTKGAEDMLAFQWWFKNLKRTKMTVAFFKLIINILNACAVNNIIGFWLPSIHGILEACWGFLITKEEQEHPKLDGCTLIMNHF